MSALSDVLYNATNLQSVYLVVMSAFTTIKYWTYENQNGGLIDNSNNILIDNSGVILGMVESAYLYQTPFPFDGNAYVTGGQYNGTPMVQTESVDECAATANSFYWDQVNIYTNPPVGADPMTSGNWVTITLTYFFCTHTEKIFNTGTFDDPVFPNIPGLGDVYFQPLVIDVPGTSLAVEQDFSGVGQVSSSSTTLDNSTGFFDSLSDLDWDAGQTIILLGADQPEINQFMGFPDYEEIGVWLNDNWARTNQTFTMNNLENNQELTMNLPQRIYSVDLFPNMDTTGNTSGTPIPWAYGQIFGAPAVCIDTTQNLFKIADETFCSPGQQPVFSVEDVRMENTTSGDEWLSVSYTNVDLANGTFQVPGWDGQSGISVDFHGKTNADGTWMSNASDMMLDLLIQSGQTEINAASFAASKATLMAGYSSAMPPYAAFEQNILAPYLFLNTSTTLQNVAQTINQVVGSYLFVDADGLFNYVVFVPQAGDGLPLFDNIDILDFAKQNPSMVCQSQITINYATRIQDGWCESLTVTNQGTQYSKGQPLPVTLGPQVIQVSTEEDALYWAQRQLVFWGQKPGIYTVNLPWKANLILPSNQVLIQYPQRGNINEVFEVVEVDTGVAASQANSVGGSSNSGGTSYGASGVELTISNLHNFNNQCGFWVLDDPGTSGDTSGEVESLPVEFANLDGYGDGSLDWNSDWDPLIKAWAAQNVGYWTTDNDFIDDADPVSYMQSVWF